MSDNKTLHGLYVDSHGRAGKIWDMDSWTVDFSEISGALNYRMGAVLLNSCNGGWCAADNPQEGNLYDDGVVDGELYGPPWTQGKPGDPRQVDAGGRDLVSSSPGHVFFGLKRGLNPVTDNVDAASIFDGDVQGTK